MQPEVVGHYRILERIGQGGMGVVYRGWDTRLERPVAIKQIHERLLHDPSAVRRLRKEALAAASIDHPYICKVYELLEHDGQTLIVMEYVEGETLADSLRRRTLSVPEVLRFSVEIAEAVGEAHARQLVHCDLKPANILITRHRHVKVMDFGLARIDTQTPSDELETVSPSSGSPRAGTPYYMAPEQAVGDPVDARTDIFAIGVLIFECLTGRLPFEGDTVASYIRNLLTQPPPPLRTLAPAAPEGMERIVLKCLEKEPRRRYESAASLTRDLTRLSESIPLQGSAESAAAPPDTRQAEGLPSPVPAPGRPAGFPRRFGSLFFFLGALLVLLALVPFSWNLVEEWLDVGMPRHKHLVVLPFTAIGDHPEDRDFCDGLVAYLTSKLSQLEQFQGTLRVVPAREVFERNVNRPSQAGVLFGVNLAVTASLQRVEGRYRLTLDLVDVSSLRNIGSRVIDDPLSDASFLQEEIVVQVAEMLGVGLQPHVLQTLAAGTTAVPGALEFYLQGEGNLQRFDREANLNAAIELFRRALQEDPSYARAHAGLTQAYLQKFNFLRDPVWIEEARTSGARALELSDRLPEVYVSLGMIDNWTGRQEEAIRRFHQALELDRHSADAHRHLAKAYEALGDLQRAEATYKRAIELRKEHWAGYNQLGIFYLSQGRYDEAVAQFRQVRALVPNGVWGLNNLGAAYMHLERWEEARETFEGAVEIEPDDFAYSNLGSLYFQEGRYAEAAGMYEKALEIRDTSYALWGNLASAYYWTPGRAEAAQEPYKRAARMAEEELQVNPRSASALSNLAVYLAMLGEPGPALERLGEALALAPGDVRVMYRAIAVYEKLGNRDEALQWSERILEAGYSQARLEASPGLSDLRRDERFQRLVQSRNAGRGR